MILSKYDKGISKATLCDKHHDFKYVMIMPERIIATDGSMAVMRELPEPHKKFEPFLVDAKQFGAVANEGAELTLENEFFVKITQRQGVTESTMLAREPIKHPYERLMKVLPSKSRKVVAKATFKPETMAKFVSCFKEAGSLRMSILEWKPDPKKRGPDPTRVEVIDDKDVTVIGYVMPTEG